MKPALVCSLILVFGAVASDAPASDDKAERSCPQALAVYASQDETVSVEFSGAADLSFAMLIKGAGRPFEGFVYPGEEEGMADGVVLDNCPDGDATGDEIAACTVWQGAMRSIDQDGTEDAFALSSGVAAPGLVFAGLGDSIKKRMPELMDDPSAGQTETLTLSGCLE